MRPGSALSRSSGGPARPPGTVLEDLYEAFADLPRIFDKRDITRLLGYEPARATLYRAIMALRQEGLIANDSYSAGGTATRYRKLS
jgi:hypothetical protein